MPRQLFAAVSLLFALLLSGCGQKGELYLPDQAPAYQPTHK
jgi:predicted small lipoprotein YifL